ncbi:glycosyltransferase [Clostridium butyricum]|uniref:glycosyltransferase n=1 Tax=Clostridium butyricum TaxID=1492 RepID=UPI002ABE4885|nr:glycosyltransferase [Clostridium butyricum]
MLISIIVPIYNMQKYLRKCLDTLIKQTYDKLEIILVDDGSTDSSGVICDEYLLKDNRIKVIHKENAGVSDARNVGIAIAKGEYIGFVDPDDYIELNMYEKLLYLIKNNDCDIAICGYVIEDENGNSVKNLDKEIKNIILNSEKAMKLLINNGNLEVILGISYIKETYLII